MMLIFVGVALIIGFFLGAQYMNSDGSDVSNDDNLGSKKNIFTHTVHGDISFESFQLEYPSDMILFVNNNQISNPNYLDESANLFFRLDKGGSSMEIVSAAMGGGGCLYPGDPDQEGPFGRYGEYETLREDAGYWRRSLSLTPSSTDENPTIYTICSNVDEMGLFSTTTPVGGIGYDIKPGEERYISDFDEIVRNIKIIKK